MKFYLFIAVWWLILAIIRILFVESWSFLPDGSPANWWNVIGIRFYIASLFFYIAFLKKEG